MPLLGRWLAAAHCLSLTTFLLLLRPLCSVNLEASLGVSGLCAFYVTRYESSVPESLSAGTGLTFRPWFVADEPTSKSTSPLLAAQLLALQNAQERGCDAALIVLAGCSLAATGQQVQELLRKLPPEYSFIDLATIGSHEGTLQNLRKVWRQQSSPPFLVYKYIQHLQTSAGSSAYITNIRTLQKLATRANSNNVSAASLTVYMATPPLFSVGTQQRNKCLNQWFTEAELLRKYRWEQRCIPHRNDPGCYTVVFITNLPNISGARNISLVTQAGIDRISRIVRLYDSWTGSFSCALYLPVDSYRFGPAASRALHFARSHQRASVQLVFGGLSYEPYPINLLRTIAQREARTDYVLSVDVDFVLSHNMQNQLVRLLTPEMSSTQVFVIPAFELKTRAPCHANQPAAVSATDIKQAISKDHRCFPFPVTKSALVEAYNHKLVSVFHQRRAPEGHGATGSKNWLLAKASYSITLASASIKYEPYVLGNKSSPRWPDFDIRYVDRGLNKIVFIMNLRQAGYTFVVQPDAFVIHQWELNPVYRKYMVNRKRILRSDILKKTG